MADPSNRTHPVAPGFAERYARIRLGLLVVIALVLVGWALRAVGSIAVPLVFAFFLSLLVAPVDSWVAKRMPGRLRWLGHVAAMTAILLVLAIFLACLWISAQQVASRFSDGLGTGGSGGLASILPDLSGGDAGGGQDGEDPQGGATGQGDDEPQQGGEGQGGSQTNGGVGPAAPAAEAGQGGPRQLLRALQQTGGSFAEDLSSWASSFAGSILATAGSLVSAVVLVFFLTLLMLVEAPRWRSKLATLFSNSSREEAFDALAVIAQRLRRYLLIRTVLGILTALLYVGWLWIFGVDLLLVWGLLTVVLNYMPTVGSLISGILPVLYAFLTKDFGTAVLVGLGIFVIEQAMGNYVDPRMQGRQISLSPLVILVVLLLWGWIWGVAGAVLAVPITITFLVIGAHLPALRPFALLVSNETDMEGLERSAGR